MLASNGERLQTCFNGAHLGLKRRVFPKGPLGVIRKGKKITMRSVKKFSPGRRKRENSLASRRRIANFPTIFIESTHNNTIYTLASSRGKTHCCIPTGRCGFKNTRKSTSYASQAAAEKLAALAKANNISQVSVKIRGVGPGKSNGVRALHQSGLRIGRVIECTSLPHNGCRPPKLRRI